MRDSISYLNPGNRIDRIVLRKSSLDDNTSIILGNLFFNEPKKPVQNYAMSTDGLILWVDGKDFKNSPPTTIWEDKSGSGNDLIIKNMEYTISSGSDGKGGVVLDGVNDWCDSNLHFDIKNGFTIESDFEFTKLSSTKRNIWTYTNGGLLSDLYVGFTLSISPDSKLLCVESYDINQISKYIYFKMTIGERYTATVRFDVDNRTSLYINGIFINSINSTGIIINPLTKFGIGSYPGNTIEELFDETLYSSLVYGRALTNFEILSNYKYITEIPFEINIISCSRNIISANAGVSSSTVVFQSTQNLTRWEARANGTGIGSGLLVGSGSTTEKNTDITFDVDYSELTSGDIEYRIDIYGVI